ncbi:TPA: transcription elongation factor Spt4 [Candidatus Bathyarchaeota archaeon]|nr:transcription elongation factor Spt4 [Candidatus Bathyarchaeota archaeon]
MSERACRTCHLIARGAVCPNCKGRDLSRDFVGMVAILDVDGSQVAKRMGIKRKGFYAVRVR